MKEVMGYIFVCAGIGVFIISLFYTDLIAVDASLTVKRMLGILTALSLYNKGQIDLLEADNDSNSI